MTIVATTPYPASRIQFNGEETDLGVKSVVMSLWPSLEIGRWQLNENETIGFPVAMGFSLTPVLFNPDGVTTLWTDGATLYFGALPIAGAGTSVTGSGAAGQVTYWSGTGTVTGQTGLTYDDGSNILTAGNIVRTGFGDPSSPSYSFFADSASGLYAISPGVLGLSAGGVLKLSIGATALTSTVLGIFPASASGASGYASIRLNQGVAPTTNLTNGDVWITTAGMFARVNGGTVGPFNVGSGTIGGSATNTQIAYGVGGNNLGSDSGLVYIAGSNQIQILSSSAALPAYSFSGDPDTGLYHVGANDLGFSTNGVLRLDISATAINAVLPITSTLGSSTALTFTHTGSSTGSVTMGSLGDRDGANTFDALQLINGAASTSLTVQLFDAGTLAFVGGGAITQFTLNKPLAVPVGSAGAPSYAFTGDLSTGLYRVGASDIGLSTGGTLRLDVSTTAVTSTLPFLGAAGSVGAPQYSFDGDPDSGLYSVGANDVGLAAGGVSILTASTTTVTVNGKLTVTGLIDPTGLALTPVAANPGGGLAASTIWVNSGDALLYFGATVAGQQPFAVGSAGAPSITFTGDPTTGLYHVAASDVGISTGGVLRFDVSATAVTSTLPLYLPDGSAGAPALAWAADTDTGLYRIGSNSIGVALNGLLVTAFSVSALTLSLQLLGVVGTALLPGFSFDGDPNTGIYNVGADDLGFSTNGILRLDISTTAVTSTLPLVLPAGSAALPSLTFDTDSNTGVFWVGANDLGFATDGSLRLDISTTALTSTLPFLGEAGTAGAPSVAFSGDTNTGLFSVGADDLGFAVGGTLRVDISTVALTSTVLGIFPASTAGAGGYASLRLPHGVAPTTNLTNGDFWSTTAGAFMRVNGVTVGPFIDGSVLNASNLTLGTLPASAEPAHIGDVTNSAGSLTLTIATGAVTDTKASLATKPASTVVATSSQTLSGLATIDGITTADGSIVLATAQTTGSDNGPWVVHAGAWTRPTWYPSGGTTQAFQFITTLIRLGTTYQGTTWRMTTGGAITIDTTSTTWVVTPYALNASTVTGTLPASVEPAHTGDVTNTAGSLALTIATGAVTDTKASLATKPAAMVVATSNLTLSGEQTIDGVLTSASIVLLTAQSSGSQNGPWMTAAGAWTRPTWYPAGGTTQAFQFITELIRLGTTYQGTTWRMTTAGVITIDTTSTTWVATPLALNSNTVTGTLPVAQFPANELISGPGVVVDGSGTVLSTGSKGTIQVLYSGTITNWTVTADVSGSIVVDVKRTATVTTPTGGASLVGAGNKPTLTSAQGATAAVSGWTSTAVTAGDVLEWNIDSVSTITRVTVQLKMTRT